MDNVSVIIRAKNEERWIGHTIQSVLDWISQPEIIVVDNHSTDDTIHIVQHFQQDPKLNGKGSTSYTTIKTVAIDQYTPGRSINLGVKHSSRDYILVISSHCVLKKFNLKKHTQDLENYICVFGNQVRVWNGKKIIKRYIWSHFQDKEVVNMYSKHEDRYFMHNGLALYKKATLVDMQFDEYLVAKEDRYWANKVIGNGTRILYDPAMEAEHHYTVDGNTWKGIG